MAQRTNRMTPEEAREAIVAGACPEGASVDGRLLLEDADSLTELPRGLRVDGELWIRGCNRLRLLPAGLSAQALRVEACSLMEGFAPDFGGAFGAPRWVHFESCPSLHSLPDALSAGGDLSLVGCHRLTALPRSLSARSVLVGDCAALEGFHADASAFEAAGTVRFLNCPSLHRFPESLAVGRDLLLIDCPRAWASPAGEPGGAPRRLSVGGTATLERCAALSRLPEDAAIGVRLYVDRCHRLERLGGLDGPRPLRVGFGCSVERCQGLRRIDHIAFRRFGSLEVVHCLRVEAIGDGVRPQRKLRLVGCGALERLPAALSLDGALVARDCPSLAGPQGVSAPIVAAEGTTPRWEGAEAAAAKADAGPSP